MRVKRILLLEDDQAIAKNLVLLLRAEGFSVAHAATMRQALELVSGEKFDLALVDIALPDGNGVRRLHADAAVGKHSRHLFDGFRR